MAASASRVSFSAKRVRSTAGLDRRRNGSGNRFILFLCEDVSEYAVDKVVISHGFCDIPGS